MMIRETGLAISLITAGCDISFHKSIRYHLCNAKVAARNEKNSDHHALLGWLVGRQEPNI